MVCWKFFHLFFTQATSKWRFYGDFWARCIEGTDAAKKLWRSLAFSSLWGPCSLFRPAVNNCAIFNCNKDEAVAVPPLASMHKWSLNGRIVVASTSCQPNCNEVMVGRRDGRLSVVYLMGKPWVLYACIELRMKYLKIADQPWGHSQGTWFSISAQMKRHILTHSEEQIYMHFYWSIYKKLLKNSNNKLRFKKHYYIKIQFSV